MPPHEPGRAEDQESGKIHIELAWPFHFCDVVKIHL